MAVTIGVVIAILVLVWGCSGEAKFNPSPKIRRTGGCIRLLFYGVIGLITWKYVLPFVMAGSNSVVIPVLLLMTVMAINLGHTVTRKY